MKDCYTRNYISRFESLPNEILIDLFHHFSSQELFRVFYKLNARLNGLLESLYYLSLIVSSPLTCDHVYLSFIRRLTIDRAVNVDLNRLPRIRRLTLIYPTAGVLAQIQGCTLPCLEYLTVNHMHNTVMYYIPHLCRKVFSNDFPTLIFGNLFQWSTIADTEGWTQVPSLRTLKTGQISLLVYRSILSTCPNLRSLQFSTVAENNTSVAFQPHRNLKQLIIKTTVFAESWPGTDLDPYLADVPNIEYFSFHRTGSMLGWSSDWLASTIARYLIRLRRFNFYVYVFDIELIIEPALALTLTQMEERFHQIHPHRYQSRFFIERAQLFWITS